MDLYVPSQLHHSLDPTSYFLAFNLQLKQICESLLLHQLKSSVCDDGINLIKALLQQRLVVLHALFELVLYKFDDSSCSVIYIKVIFDHLYLQILVHFAFSQLFLKTLNMVAKGAQRSQAMYCAQICFRIEFFEIWDNYFQLVKGLKSFQFILNCG